MPIWMNGQSTVVATSWGIARSTKDACEVYRFPRTGLRRAEDPPAMVFFVALDKAGKRAIFRRKGERAHIWTHKRDGMSVVPVKGGEVFDAVPCGQGLLTLVVEAQDGWERLELRSASLEAGRASVDIGEAVTLTPGPRMTWPSRFWREGEEPWAESAVLGARQIGENWVGPARVSANRCGIALTSSSSGTVAFLDGHGRLRWSATLPADPGQLEIHALPLPDEKLLVAYAASYGQNEYVLLADAEAAPVCRSELGDKPAWGARSAGLLWSDDTVLVSSRDVTWALGLPQLTARKFAGHAAVVDFGSSADPGRHVLAFASQEKPQPHNWNLVGYEVSEKKPKTWDVPLPDFRPVAPPPEDTQPRAKGPVLLGAVAAESSWQIPLGADREIDIIVSNRGGPVENGFYIQVGGVAKKNGLVELVGATISMADETAADLVKDERTSRVDFPGASLYAGFVVEKPLKKVSKAPPPPEQPSLSVTVTLRGVKQGSGLLTVRVGPLGTEGHRGSALVGRNLSVD